MAHIKVLWHFSDGSYSLLDNSVKDKCNEGNHDTSILRVILFQINNSYKQYGKYQF